MATTATLLMPYPVLSASANVPSDIQALANRIETLFTTNYAVPAMIRVKNPSDNTGFGAGVYTVMSGWTQDYVKGPASQFTLTTGTVTVANAGIYLLVLNVSCSAGSSSGEAKLTGAAGRVYCRAPWPSGDMILSCSAVEYLAAGATVTASVFNGSGSITIQGDATGAPCAYSVTRLAASS